MPITDRGRLWELGHSVWMAWLLTFGLLNGLGFLYVGLRARRPAWVLSGAAYLVPGWGLFVSVLEALAYQEPARYTLALAWFVAVGAVGVVSSLHALAIRPAYLQFLAATEPPVSRLGPAAFAQAGDLQAPPPARSRRRFGALGAGLPNPRPLRDRPTDEACFAFARMVALHQIARGASPDVLCLPADGAELFQSLEAHGWIEVDAARLAYRLTGSGQRCHRAWLADARALVRAYDLYADVDVDARGNTWFATGLGRDLRVPVYERAGIDPFEARLLVGLHDGEWDGLPDWPAALSRAAWFEEVFAPVREAPTVEAIGPERLDTLIERGKAVLRANQPLPVAPASGPGARRRGNGPVGTLSADNQPADGS